MAIQNNLREVKAWIDENKPQIPPVWVLDILRKSDSAPGPRTQVPINIQNTVRPVLTNSNPPQISHPKSVQPPKSAQPQPATLLPTRPLQASTQLNSKVEEIPDFSDNDSDSYKLIDMSKLAMPKLKRQSTLDSKVIKKPRVEQRELLLPVQRISPPTRATLATGTQKGSIMDTQNGVQNARKSNSLNGSMNGNLHGTSVGQNGPRYPPNGLCSADLEVTRLQKYIRICEAKINLLSKRHSINESTSLSLDAKKMWNSSNFQPQFAEIETKQMELRPAFTFLDPLPSEEDLSKISNANSNLNSSMVSMLEGPSHFSQPVLSSPRQAVRASPAKMPLENPSRVKSPSPPRAVPINSNILGFEMAIFSEDELEEETNVRADYQANNMEARRIILESRERGPMPIEDDDLEDDFGEDFMDGLRSSQVDNDDTDLSGFLARDDDAESIDETFSTPQGTQVDSDHLDSEEVESQGQPLQKTDLQYEIQNIVLSQDVADRLGMKYDDALETIDVSDDDDKEVNPMDFTTQLNEGRDEVVEIFSEDDLGDDDLTALSELLHLNIKLERNIQPVILSESDFSDDDDELLQLSKTVSTGPKERSSKRTVIPGSEGFIDEVYDVLTDVFKLPKFRSNQLEAVVSTLKGKDVFVLIPTGGGKSLCYQLPALVKGGKTRGTTVVISPLISLMQDQVQHLLDKNIKAGMISSKGTSDERNATFRELTSGQLDLVYLSPEMVNNSARVQKIIEKLYENDMLARVVVDEAHCVSSWGHDFRPDYKGMNMFKQKFPRVPIMALTATANEKVRLDIVHHLQMSNPVLLKQSFNRTNLFYDVRSKPPNFYEWIRDYVAQKQRGRTGIIYCHSKQSCETTAQKLNEWGIRAMHYHAGMDPDERFEVQTKWQHNTIQLICATIAFGMGIDKPDVRFVIHMYIPRSLEGYYQETGRAGRDGDESECIMFYSYKDARSLQSLIQRDDKLEKSARETHLAKLRQVIQYCENKVDCRRKQVLHFFNEVFDPKECARMCDNCCSDVVSEMRDVTEHCVNITKLVHRIQEDKVTVIHCQDVYKGSKSNKIMKLNHHENPFHGLGKNLDRGDMERIFFHLQSEGGLFEYQVMRGGFASTYVKLGPNANEIMNGRKKMQLSFAQNDKSRSTASSKTTSKARLTASGNGAGLTNFRYQESFVSAREFRYQEEQEKENTNWRTGSSSKIVLPCQDFDGAVTQRNEHMVEHAFTELRNLRLQKLQELKFGRPSHFIGDQLLKEMVVKLPTNARDFAKLEGITKEQVPYFQYFKKALATLSRERKKSSQSDTQQSSVTQANSTISENMSPYFQRTQQTYAQKNTKRQGNKSRSSQKRSGGYKRPANKGLQSSSHIKHMPI